ncbi:hypothetical protein PAXINDRAFT_15687 [Paxillus involutus ATCC 200175]|uniref:Uncharacterized protein n=1 Tax=Paxillus involutus ATCC 200175 TaxID=664439 RepID=A0A0C9TUM7_PAXIN|nr:hypothetical protein PAXINDRAFT_15687 [Paxillus involutus ATCC 200175]
MSLLSRFVLDQGLTAAADGPQTGENSEGEPGGGSGLNNNSSAATARNGTLPGRASSLTPSPPATPQRRSRVESLEANAEHVAKRRKQFAAKVCREKGLPEGALDAFAVMDAAEMAITTYATLLAKKQEQEKNDAFHYICSEEFKDILKDRLRSCLLSPNLTAYVIDLASNVFAYAKKNLSMLKIPPGAIEDPELLDHIDMLIKEILTSQRSNVKQKLSNSINIKLHISVLAKSLAPSGFYEITTAHWCRFSFLRASMTSFDTIVDECAATATAQRKKVRRKRTRRSAAAEAPAEEEEAAGNEDESVTNEGAIDGNGGPDKRIWTNSDFWEYVDCLLADLRATAVANEQTAEGRKKYIKLIFTTCLQNDMKTYVGTVSQAAVPASENVTVQWQNAIHNELVW